jgi:hypothetical protein
MVLLPIMNASLRNKDCINQCIMQRQLSPRRTFPSLKMTVDMHAKKKKNSELMTAVDRHATVLKFPRGKQIDRQHVIR